jgi:hypothetical protein
MQLIIRCVLIGVFVAIPTIVGAQGKAPVQIDEFGPINSEEIEARLDNAMIQIRNNPNTQLQFVFTRGEKDSFGSAYRLYGLMRTYLLVRKFDMNDVIATFCEPGPSKSGQLWMVYADGPRRTCTAEKIVITGTSLFDSAPSATNKGTDFGCCVVDSFGPAAATESIKAFAELLKQYPDSKAYVYSYGGTNVYWTSDSRGRDRTVRNLDTANEIAALSRKTRRILIQSGISTKRIVTRSAGYRDSVARIELWIVPTGGTIPKTSPDYPKKKKKS